MSLGTTGKRWLTVLAIATIALSAGFAAACGGDDDDGDDGGAAAGISPAATEPAGEATEPVAEATEPAGEATEPAREAATIIVGEDATLGEILTDFRGFTLYTFANDAAGAGTSACLEGCAAAWPPLTIEGEGNFADDIAAKVTTFERPDGTTQVAYDGMPLYFFASDTEAGQTNGHEVGGVWFVAAP